MKSATMITLIAALFCVGCQTTGGNIGRLQSYPTTSIEAEWIRNGEPITFEEEQWYPADSVEGFLDSEMMPIGTYKDVRFFIDKVDVRPYKRLYTKFGRNQFHPF